MAISRALLHGLCDTQQIAVVALAQEARCPRLALEPSRT
jgi:hypothetical protein